MEFLPEVKKSSSLFSTSAKIMNNLNFTPSGNVFEPIVMHKFHQSFVDPQP